MFLHLMEKAGGHASHALDTKGFSAPFLCDLPQGQKMYALMKILMPPPLYLQITTRFLTGEIDTQIQYLRNPGSDMF